MTQPLFDNILAPRAEAQNEVSTLGVKMCEPDDDCVEYSDEGGNLEEDTHETREDVPVATSTRMMSVSTHCVSLSGHEEGTFLCWQLTVTLFENSLIQELDLHSTLAQSV